MKTNSQFYTQPRAALYQLLANKPTETYKTYNDHNI